MNRIPIFLVTLCMAVVVTAQQGDVTGRPGNGPDSQGDVPGSQGDSSDTLRFTEDQAILFIESLTARDTLWRSADEPLRTDLERLVLHAREPFDTIRQRLSEMDFHEVDVKPVTLTEKHEVGIRWLNDSTFIIDTIGWNRELLVKTETRLVYPERRGRRQLGDTLNPSFYADSLFNTPDTVVEMTIDTATLESLNISMYRFDGRRILPSLNDRSLRRSARVKADVSSVIFTDSSMVWMADTASPFYIMDGPGQPGLLREAMLTLLEHLGKRDSVRLLINDMYGRKTPVWISEGSSDSYRFWVKNYKNDSITLWIGNPGKNEISLLLEDEIDVNRLTREEVPYLPRIPEEPPRVLKKIELLEPMPVYWDKEIASAFSFNQNYLSNWSKGGENSLSTMLDVTGNAVYNNSDIKAKWINSARVNIGSVITQEHGLRKNNDQVEINSQFNRKAWGSRKLDISASLFMKSQLARGYNYPDDSTIISKFLNPGALTLGLGVDYKPFKHTSINVAPLSYKNTFVLDTATIDQTRHGVGADQRARQEMGAQVVVRSKVSPLEDLTVTNSLRLFSNYLSNPENIDVDWEMIVDKKIAWFFTVRLNLHLIYDDDIRFPVLDGNGDPVQLPGGGEKKVPKVQFKEFIGLSLLFKL